MTHEGQETLAMAQSLLQELQKLISNASVTVEILKLLETRQQRFLDLLKMSAHVGSHGERMKSVSSKDTMEQFLAARIEEFEEFRKVRTQVGLFVNMCELISPGKEPGHGQTYVYCSSLKGLFTHNTN